jgi:hypothetical protein
MRPWTRAISSAAADWPVAGDGLGAMAAREATGLTAGEAPGVAAVVGMGVRRLRVSVAAAPGTGVGSAVSNDEHPPAAVAASRTSAAIARRRTGTQAV